MAVKIGDKELRFGLREPRAFFLLSMKSAVFLELPRPLRFVENDDVIDGCVLVPQPVIPKVMHILDERLHGLPHDPTSRVIARFYGRRVTSSRVSASRSTATKGPFPERNTAWVGCASSRFLVATLRPTNVLPAPGTPVTNTN